MKIAIAGKGGVGKSTISAIMARCMSDAGERVLLVDADPDENLAALLGIHDETSIRPISDLKELITERTVTGSGGPSPLFRMNPKVDDIPDTYFVERNLVRLIVMGTISGGGAGCACPENAFIKSLVTHLVLNRNEHVIMDMVAGIEHLGRGTAAGVDLLFVVVEPGLASLHTASRIRTLATGLGIKKITMIGNCVRSADERSFIAEHADSMDIAGFIPFMEDIVDMNRGKKDVFSLGTDSVEHVKRIVSDLTSRLI